MKQILKTIAFIALLLVLLVYLLLRSSSPDIELHRSMQEQLRVFELRDAELTRDALLARAGLLGNYDPLAHDRLNLLDALAALRRVSRSGPRDAVAGLEPAIDELERALETRLTDIESFKTDDALLRNSVAYLTYTIARLDVHAAPRQAMGTDISDLSSSFLRFIQMPNAASTGDFQAALLRIDQHDDADEDLHILAAHGGLVAELLPRVVAELRQIVNAPTTARLGALQAKVEAYSKVTESKAQIFRNLLFIVSLALLAYLLRQFARLRAYGRDLSLSNAELSREIGERKQAEAALRESEERFRAIANSAHDAIISADSQGAIVSWNPGAQTAYGYTSDEAIGMPLQQLLPERLRASAAPLLPRWHTPAGTGESALLAGKTIESIGLNKAGSEFPLEASIGSWSTAQGSFVTAIVRDISARRRLEETARQQELKLVQANKMTALGTLVSGVAHEINNPNQLVLFNSGLLADTWRDACIALDAHHAQDSGFTLAGLPYAEMREAAFTLIRDLKEGALRIDRIVQDLKDFARPQRQSPPVAVDVNDAVSRAARLLTHLIHKRCTRFEIALAAQLPAVRGDAQQIEQVVVDLLVNALEALPDASRGVRVSTSAETTDGSVLIEVRDEGIGIAPEHLQRLCDPFFTTKQDSGGTGLGLSVTFSLVQAHGGRLDFESEPGCGTRAIVSLPGDVPPAAPASP